MKVGGHAPPSGARGPTPRGAQAFSEIFELGGDSAMRRALEAQGDCPATVAQFFTASTGSVRPCGASTLSLAEAEAFLQRMAGLTRLEEQVRELRAITRRCTAADLEHLLRQIKGDLKMHAKAAVVLPAMGPGVLDAYKAQPDLERLVQRVQQQRGGGGGGTGEALGAIVPGEPISPMLATPAKGVPQAFAKCKQGCLAEVKYDGERLQVHRSGGGLVFYSRSLKPVKEDKVTALRPHIAGAFPGGGPLVLDAEVLMVDPATGQFLDFNTHGVRHVKGGTTAGAQPCLVVFDALHLGGQPLLDVPLEQRRAQLEAAMVPIPGRVQLSELRRIRTEAELDTFYADARARCEEGLMVKDAAGLYQPGKRKWIKLKRDHTGHGVVRRRCCPPPVRPG